MPKRRQLEQGMPLPESLESAQRDVREALNSLLNKANDRRNAEQQLAIKLGLPENRFDWSKVDRLTEIIWGKINDVEGVVKDAGQWLKREQAGHPNPLSTEEEKLMSAYLAANILFQLIQYLYGGFSVGYADPKQRTFIHDSYTKGSIQIVSVPDLPFIFSPKPTEYLSNIDHNRWNRGFDFYEKVTTENPLTLIQKLIANKGRITILDEGRGDSYFLNLVKRTFGRNVRTLGIGMVNSKFSDRPIDDDRIRPAELMPADWSHSVDLAVSLQAYRYFLFPERAIAETLRVLKNDGQAHLDVSTYFNSELVNVLDPCLEAAGIRIKAETLTKEKFKGFTNAQTTIKTVQRIAQSMGHTISVTCVNNGHNQSNILHIIKHA